MATRGDLMRRAGESPGLYQPREAVPGVAARLAWPVRRETTIDPAALAEARQLAEQSASRALLVWRRGHLELQAYFAGAGPDTPLVSRSLAKPLATLAVGRAIALGHIRSLDQPVADFVLEWRRDVRRSRILLRHLLDMRSGLLAQGIPSGPDDVLNRAYLHPRHDEVIVTEYPAPDEPGTRFEYSNANNSLVARVIERATGRRYAEFIGTELMQPLGAAPGEVWINRPGGTAHSGCCLLTPADTWLRLALLLLRDGVWEGQRLLPAGFVKEVRTPTAQNPYFGLGVFVAGRYIERRSWGNPATVPIPGVQHGEPYQAADLYLFDGNANQVVYIVPSEDLVIVRVGERPPRTPEWDNARLANLILRGIRRERGSSVPQPRD
jgi:CubicO group peptidase (beta-lactamase class C family)